MAMVVASAISWPSNLRVEKESGAVFVSANLIFTTRARPRSPNTRSSSAKG
jgi:hypothetical protein